MSNKALYMGRIGLLSGVCLSVLALAETANAQEAASQNQQTSSESGVIEVITVTARRQTEQLQEVPASISVITSDLIENAGVKSLEDVSQLVPNLTFNKTFRAGVPDIAIRGMATPQGGEAPVAVIVDGVEEPSLEFYDQDLLDIQDVEVLRGPQGSIYGRGAIAGAVIINTATPTEDFHNIGQVDYGNGNDVRAVDTLSGPIFGEKLLGKITVADVSNDGLIQDQGTLKPADWVHEVSAHGELLSQISPDTTVDLRGSYLGGREGAAYQSIFPNSLINAYVNPYRQLNTYDSRSQESASLKIEQVTALGTFTSISQWAESHSDLYGSSPILATVTPNRIQHNIVGVNSFNEDFRFSTDQSKSVRGFVGAFYQDRVTHNWLDVVTTAVPPATLAFRNDQQASVASAVYGQIDADLPADLSLTVGLRYDTDSRRDVDLYYSGSNAHTSFSAVQPQGTLREKFTPNIMGYVTIGRGFNSGGFNSIQDAVSINVPRIYNDELATNYEGGFKSTFFDNKLVFNGDYFYETLSNDQLYIVQTIPVPARDILNINHATIDGVELELTYKPINPLTFNVNFGLNNTQIGNYNGTSLDVGNKLPNSYGSTLDIGAQYEGTVTDGVNWLARVDYQNLGKIYWSIDNNSSSAPENRINARLGIEVDHWTVALWGRNLTGQKGWSFVNYNSGGPGVSSGYLAPPMTYGIEIVSRY